VFERLFPPGGPAPADELLAVPQDRRVLLNMVSSLDGRVTRDGGSTQLGGDGDKAMFHALRGVVDAVLVGTGTLRAESYGRIIASPERRAAREARGLSGDAALLVISRSGDVPWEAPLFGVSGQRVVIAGPAQVPGSVRAQVQVVDAVEPRPALDAFAELGFTRVLCEGGPGLNRSLLAAGVVDELFLTLDASLSGGDGLRLVKGETFDPPIPAELQWVLRAGDELFLRYSL
jgi:riboflavin biosynthesis pyrimidine reductase